MDTSDILNAAADHIEANGWASPTRCEGPDPTCAHVAIRRVAEPGEWEAVRVLWEYLGGTFVDTIWHWNDAPERTAAEVVEALRACALVESAKEVDVRVVEPRVAVS